MDFARKQLQKYGWKEGQGLGKEESGIIKPIKIRMKRDNAGVGTSPGEEFSSDWWSKLFNKAARNISVVTAQDSIQIKSDVCDSGLSFKSKHYGRNRSTLLYGGFTSSSLAYKDGTESSEGLGIRMEGGNSGEEDDSTRTKRLSDEAMIRACEGRTGHKAARHGLKLCGKLKRLKEQEETLIQMPPKKKKK